MRINRDYFRQAQKSVVLVGLMGAGKTAIGKRLADTLRLPFIDADEEIERAAGISIAEIFARHGEPHFRAGEKRVIARLLQGRPIVLATGGGAFMDEDTRAMIAARGISVWLRAPLAILLRRVQGRSHRPLLNSGDPAATLMRLSAAREPVYAAADIIINTSEDPPSVTTAHVAAALSAHIDIQRLPVATSAGSYEVMIGAGLLAQAGALLRPHLPRPRVMIVTDETVAALHLPTLTQSLDAALITHHTIIVPPGEASKSVASWTRVCDELLAAGADRHTTVIGFGGGVVGDLAGFAAAATLRGLPFIQIPTTLLAQVDSSVGGKTGINTTHGKNLIGAFHQPRAVLADIALLASLPVRERAAGYAEIVKAGLIADAAFYDWCEANAAGIKAGAVPVLTEAVARAVAFKAAVVAADERETAAQDGRALLNLGHTFAHALEAEQGYGNGLLHGEAVAIGLALAARLSARLGHCTPDIAPRLEAHLAATGLPTRIPAMYAQRLLAHMRFDKKNRDGALTFILLHGIGRAFTSAEVPPEAVRDTLLDGGAVLGNLCSE
jgi:shikimate kinase/3-dehydroquinate synthase